MSNAQFIVLEKSDLIEEVMFLNSQKPVYSASIPQNMKYAAICDKSIIIDGNIKCICKSNQAAFSVMKNITEMLDCKLYDDKTIESYYEVIKNEDVEDFFMIQSSDKVDYAIMKNASAIRESDTVFSFDSILKLTVKSKELGDKYHSLYPRHLTKDSEHLKGRFTSQNITKIVPDTPVLGEGVFNLTEIDGGTF